MAVPIVPTVPGGGNTISPPSSPKTPPKKQISPALRWCFTLNHYTDEEISSIVPILEEKCRVACCGYEVGDEGTPHVQGYVEFKTKCRPVGAVGLPRIHWEKAKGNKEQNVRYCSKAGDVFLALGIPKQVKTIDEKDFYLWQKEMTDVFKKPCAWNCRTMYWRYGPPEIGKTQWVKWLCLKMGAVVISGQERHMLSQVQNSDKDTPIYIILLAYGDEMVSYSALEKIKDGLFSTAFGCDNNKMEIRNAAHMLVIGNSPPDTTNRNFHPTKWDVKEISQQR